MTAIGPQEPDTTAPAADAVSPPGAPTRHWGSRGTVIIGALAALVLLAVGATLGVALAPRSSAPVNSATVTPGPVDVGFSQDMIVHHTQGVSMANLEQRNGSSAEVKTMAFDIASTQQTDIGEMGGWLDLWGKPRNSIGAPMSWMGGMSSGMAGMNMPGLAVSSANSPAGNDGAVMPGMATNTELAKLASLQSAESDVYFLQLMIRHHQGGGQMMAYAAQHASVPAVRLFAQKMLDAQTQEIALMTQMLTERGATTLPFPALATTG